MFAHLLPKPLGKWLVCLPLLPALGLAPHMEGLERNEKIFCFKKSYIPKELQILVLYNLSPVRGLNNTQSCSCWERLHLPKAQMCRQQTDWTVPRRTLSGRSELRAWDKQHITWAEKLRALKTYGPCHPIFMTYPAGFCLFIHAVFSLSFYLYLVYAEEA